MTLAAGADRPGRDGAGRRHRCRASSGAASAAPAARRRRGAVGRRRARPLETGDGRVPHARRRRRSLEDPRRATRTRTRSSSSPGRSRVRCRRSKLLSTASRRRGSRARCWRRSRASRGARSATRSNRYPADLRRASGHRRRAARRTRRDERRARRGVDRGSDRRCDPGRRSCPSPSIPPAAADALKLPETPRGPHRGAVGARRTSGSSTRATSSWRRASTSSRRRRAGRGRRRFSRKSVNVVEAVPVDELRVTASPRTAAVLRSGSARCSKWTPRTSTLLVERWARRARRRRRRQRGRRDRERTADRARRSLPRRSGRCSTSSQRNLERGAGAPRSGSRLRRRRHASPRPTQLHVDGDIVYADESLDHRELLRRLGRAARARARRHADRADHREQAQRGDPQAAARGPQARRTTRRSSRSSCRGAPARRAARLAARRRGGARRAALDHDELARLAFAVHGVETLKVFRDDFEEAGLQPPRTWAGSREAVEFVRGLGFGQEHAGFPGANRDRVLEVDGPPGLNDLHEYQLAVVDAIHELLAIDPTEGRPRGIVSLPTGAGKTRVAIEGADRGDQGRAGSARRSSGSRSATSSASRRCRRGASSGATAGPQRATHAQPTLALQRCRARGRWRARSSWRRSTSSTAASWRAARYDWLKQATCIVIDEAHFATGPSYTRLLEWQGMDRGKERVPLIGLTATPYRGISEEDTKRLVNRFGARGSTRPRSANEDPYAALQEMGVLSQAEHRVSEGLGHQARREGARGAQAHATASVVGRRPARRRRRPKSRAARVDRVASRRLDDARLLRVARARAGHGRAAHVARHPGRHRVGQDAARGAAPLRRGVQGRSAPRPHELRRVPGGLRRPDGPRRLRRAPDVLAERLPADGRARPSRAEERRLAGVPDRQRRGQRRELRRGAGLP